MLPFVHHNDYVCPLPEGHRFPMPKFNMIREILAADGVRGEFVTPTPATVDQLLAAHTPAYVEAVLTCTLDPTHIRKIGLPLSPALVQRTRLEVGGTLLAARLALDHQQSAGLATTLAGGTHHAAADQGSGFCIFNDLAVAAALLLREQLVRRVLIVDLDVHQGDGTALIFQDDPRVFTFSMHGQANFPLHKQRSSLDVPLDTGLTDEPYLALLRHHLPAILHRFDPDLVLYDAGVDVHEMDRLGKLKLTTAGLIARDRYVLQTCLENEIPTACVIGGGYSFDLAELSQRHAIVHRVAAELV